MACSIFSINAYLYLVYSENTNEKQNHAEAVYIFNINVFNASKLFTVNVSEKGKVIFNGNGYIGLKYEAAV